MRDPDPAREPEPVRRVPGLQRADLLVRVPRRTQHVVRGAAGDLEVLLAVLRGARFAVASRASALAERDASASWSICLAVRGDTLSPGVGANTRIRRQISGCVD